MFNIDNKLIDRLNDSIRNNRKAILNESISALSYNDQLHLFFLLLGRDENVNDYFYYFSKLLIADMVEVKNYYEAISVTQKNLIKSGYHEGFSYNKIASYSIPGMDNKAVSLLYYGYLSGLDIKQSSIYADPKYTAEERRFIRQEFLDGHSKKEVKKKLKKRKK